MAKKVKQIISDIFNVERMILPEPSLTDGLGFPIVNDDGSTTFNRVKDVFFYNDLEHAKMLDPNALRQVLSTEMTEQGIDPAELENEDTLNDVFDSCPSRYLYSPHDIKEYVANLKHGIQSRKEYAQRVLKSKSKS